MDAKMNKKYQKWMQNLAFSAMIDAFDAVSGMVRDALGPRRSFSSSPRITLATRTASKLIAKALDEIEAESHGASRAQGHPKGIPTPSTCRAFGLGPGCQSTFGAPGTSHIRPRRAQRGADFRQANAKRVTLTRVSWRTISASVDLRGL